MLQSSKFGRENDLFSYKYEKRVKLSLSTAQQNIYNQSLEKRIAGTLNAETCFIWTHVFAL